MFTCMYDILSKGIKAVWVEILAFGGNCKQSAPFFGGTSGNQSILLRSFEVIVKSLGLKQVRIGLDVLTEPKLINSSHNRSLRIELCVFGILLTYAWSVQPCIG